MGTGGKRQILIIDKSDHTGKLIKAVLNDSVLVESLSIDKVITGPVQNTIKGSPDIVILDISSAGPSGFQIIKQIKNTHSDAKLVMFTNYTNEIHKASCLQMGADYFLDRTTQFERLIELILD